MSWAAVAGSVIGAVGAGAAAKKSAKSAKRSEKVQREQNESNQAFIERQTDRAREDALRLFPAGQQARQIGTQSALDVLARGLPAQIGAFQQGNVGAQQALLSGLPQMNNAILGGPIDYSALQPQTIGFDPSIFSQQIPDYLPQAQPAPQVTNAGALPPSVLGGQLPPAVGTPNHAIANGLPLPEGGGSAGVGDGWTNYGNAMYNRWLQGQQPQPDPAQTLAGNFDPTRVWR